MDEIETRILNIDQEKVTDRLLELGAKRIFNGESHSVYFDHFDGRITSTNQRLRLRKENGIQTLALKSCRKENSMRSFSSHIVEVHDIEIAKQLLEGLGFCANLLTKKHRQTYLFKGVRIEIDKYTASLENVPTYVEIKAQSQEELYSMVGLLGFSTEDCCDWDIDKIDEKYSRE